MIFACIRNALPLPRFTSTKLVLDGRLYPKRLHSHSIVLCSSSIMLISDDRNDHKNVTWKPTSDTIL